MVNKKERFYIWIYYYGSKEEAMNYNCTIKAFGDEEYSYNGPPSSLDESKDTIIREENALSLGAVQVKRIVDKHHGHLQCFVKITAGPKDVEVKVEEMESGISDDNDKNTKSNRSNLKKRKVSLRVLLLLNK
jgi:hypothetical protein